MSRPLEKVSHPHVECRDGVCGGRPVVVGTRFSVRSVVGYVLRQGLTPEELVEEFPQLTLASVYDGLSYYYDHREEIDLDERANEDGAQRVDDPD